MVGPSNLSEFALRNKSELFARLEGPGGRGTSIQ